MAQRPTHTERSKKDHTRINKNITVASVRLIDHNGDMLGVMATNEALEIAEQKGFDLVEISPNADPPVCKLIDYGKYKYEIQKKAQEAKKKQKVVRLKEIKLRPNIGDHDLDVKMRNARQFIEAGNKVKVSLRFKGREITHQDIALAVLTRFLEGLADIAKAEIGPKMEGRQMIMILVQET